MSNHCRGCRYDPGTRIGEDACPFTTLYWDFLDRNRDRLARVGRIQMPLRNLARIDPGELEQIREQARGLREDFQA
jgi:deoxyribodipyrimidine photolyase-related protein